MREFVVVVQQEDETEVYRGLIKSPKVLTDIVVFEVATVYVDSYFDLKAMRLIFWGFLEPTRYVVATTIACDDAL